jgi:hypothetical protein
MWITSAQRGAFAFPCRQTSTLNRLVPPAVPAQALLVDGVPTHGHGVLHVANEQFDLLHPITHRGGLGVGGDLVAKLQPIDLPE